MPQTCVVNGCKNRYSKGKKLQFFSLPLKDTARLQKWLEAIRRENWTPSKHSRICSAHFTASDYRAPNMNVPCLKEAAVPSIFNWSPDAHLHDQQISENQPTKVLRTYVFVHEHSNSDMEPEIKTEAPSMEFEDLTSPNTMDFQAQHTVSRMREKLTAEELQPDVFNQLLAPYDMEPEIKIEAPSTEYETLVSPTIIDFQEEQTEELQTDVVQELAYYDIESQIKIETPSEECPETVHLQNQAVLQMGEKQPAEHEPSYCDMESEITIETPTEAFRTSTSPETVDLQIKPRIRCCGMEPGLKTGAPSNKSKGSTTPSVADLRKKIRILNQKIKRKDERISSLKKLIDAVLKKKRLELESNPLAIINNNILEIKDEDSSDDSDW